MILGFVAVALDDAGAQLHVREFALRVPKGAKEVLRSMGENGVLGGLSVAELCHGADPSVEGVEHVLLVTVTERRTREEIDHYVDTLRKAVR